MTAPFWPRVGAYPEEPKERCRCIRPIVESGLHMESGFGARWCMQCKRFISWGVRG